ncbi:MAG: hypothetical protein COT73_07525 [Bdellovibrio sp. CG10_big_fil_rev_8_21_14_0_10_47_8]|nr:MAG: hypothetical protein COT73_07525 [Bdellovibrio sp. CG10_big_fil_rev_8_21_14_0_10_47_8]
MPPRFPESEVHLLPPEIDPCSHWRTTGELMDLKELIDQETIHAQRLADLVRQSIEEEQLLSSRLIELEQDSNDSFGQNLADKVAEFGGSWTFILFFFSTLVVWILVNVWMLKDRPFDPYPFILLNLVLSCIAAIQAPVIMMSQNRQEEKDRRRARGDYMINLKSEIEVRSLHGKLDLLISEQMKSLFKIQQAQLELLLKIEDSIAREPRT